MKGNHCKFSSNWPNSSFSCDLEHLRGVIVNVSKQAKGVQRFFFLMCQKYTLRDGYVEREKKNKFATNHCC